MQILAKFKKILFMWFRATCAGNCLEPPLKFLMDFISLVMLGTLRPLTSLVHRSRVTFVQRNGKRYTMVAQALGKRIGCS